MNTNKIFAGVVNFFRKFPVRENRITLVEKINTGGTGSLFSIKEEYERRGMHYKFNVIKHDDYSTNPKNILGLLRLFTVKAYYMATSSHIYLNDNFMPLAYMRLSPKTKVIQLWHGMGSYKKFGGSSESEEEIALLCQVNKNVDYILASSENIRDNYVEAFCVPETKVVTIGCPQADYYFKKHEERVWRKQLERQYPVLCGKKLVLYAPTFRGDKKRDSELLSHFDFERFQKELGEEYALAVRLHPQIQSDRVPEGVINLTDYPNVRQLLVLTDILIADYSSIAVEYALLKRPIFIFAFDKDWYLKKDRGFYFDFEKTAPGPILGDTDGLIEAIRDQKWDLEKVDAFAHLHNDYFDDGSAKRVLDFLYRK